MKNRSMFIEVKTIEATIEPVDPIPLSEVVLGVSNEQYAAAHELQSEISRQLTSLGGIFCQGRICTINNGTDGHSKTPIDLECLMCQPTMQGVISDASKTRIIIVRQSQNGISAGVKIHKQLESENLDLGQWDIGAEWFILGDTVLASERSKLVDAAFTDPWLTDNVSETPSNMKDSSMAGVTSLCKSRVKLAATALEMLPSNTELVPGSYPGEDPENRGYMSLASLAKAGIVSGSWVLVEPATASTTDSHLSTNQPRAIRIFGWDRGFLDVDTLALPPLLLYNIGMDENKALESQSLSFDVLVTPLGFPPSEPSSAYISAAAKLPLTTGSEFQSPLPIAKKVVIARVSSPLSERRDFEPIAFAALRKWLLPTNSSRQSVRPLRVVKTGDLIAVQVPLADATVRTRVALVAGADTASRIRTGDSNIDMDTVDVDPTTDLILDVPAAQQTRKSLVSELVFFKVVVAEGFQSRHGTSRVRAVPSLDDDDVDESSSEYSDSDDSWSDNDTDASLSVNDKKWMLWYCQTKSKSFIIEPEITNVVQAGTEHSFVPYLSVAAYAGIGNCSSNATAHQFSTAIPYADVRSQLLRLAKASLHPLALSRNLHCAVLLKGNSGTGKRTLVNDVAENLGTHLYELNCFDILTETEDKTAQVLQMYFQNARRYTPCVLHLRSIDALAQATNNPQETPEDLPIARILKSCIANIGQAYRETGYPIIVIATSSQPDKVPVALETAFRHEIDLPVPDESTRLALVERITAKGMPLSADTNLAYIAQQTASFVARDLAMLIKRAESRAWVRLQQSLPSMYKGQQSFRIRNAMLSGLEITNEDLLGALGDARASMSDTLGVPKIPNVKWDDVGGLADAKKDILDTIRLPMEQPHLFASGLSTRSGLLFYGPPGTGKTLLAKAIATECGLNFFSCKGPELISPYIGESEANVRRIFQKAREASPCVIFFDELDSLAPKRGQQGDSGGVMDRIVSQLLAELDGMSGGGDSKDSDEVQGADALPVSSNDTGANAVQVFAIGATNRPDLLDPALLRPGRFDKLVYLGVSETHDAQLNIIQALTRKFHLHPELDLHSIAEKCPFHYTGADFYALCSDALLKAMLRTVDEVDILVKNWNEDRACSAVNSNSADESHYPVPMTPQYYLDHIADDAIKQVTVTAADFERALDELIPSVSADELVRYQELRRQFDTTQKKPDQTSIQSTADASAMLPANLLENFQQTSLADQESKDNWVADHIFDSPDAVSGQIHGTGSSSKNKRSRKGKEPEF
ncbi:peroxisomal assembly protein [Coemansia brasiliensis]|uniref:Peroxisomal ATPase PEX6 n=1 Tax=Coemansia brasiliensis TaxID=2650707 RepID=A0A9W8IBH4_9FUNG|nr:peroxisomal assembly protein [Coemansia brasiliensis]